MTFGEVLNAITPFINGTLFITLIVLIFQRKKLTAETKQIDNQREISLAKFYQEQWQALSTKYEELEKKFEEKETENIDCEARILELENKYTALLSKVNLLSKNIQS